MIGEAVDPVIESGDSYLPVITESRHRTGTLFVLFQDIKNKPYGVRTIRHQKIRNNSMTVSAITAKAGDTDAVFGSYTLFHSDQGPTIRGSF